MAINYQMLGRRIQKIRTTRKMSQFQLAERIGTSPTFVSRIECGAKGPSLETLLAIAEALNASLDALLSESRACPPQSHDDEVSGILLDCSTFERFVLLQNMKELKAALREGESLRLGGKKSIR